MCGEEVPGTLELKSDGTLTVFIQGFGPFADINSGGTWTESDGTITMVWA